MTVAASMKGTQLVQEDQLEFSKVEKLLHKLTWSGMNRLAKINLVQPYEDMFQEVFLVYMQAKSAFDASRNFKFTTYLQTSVQNFFSDYIKRNFKHGMQTDSTDDMQEFEVVDESPNPEQQYMAKCNLEIVNKELGGLSKLVLLALLYPSDEMIKAHEATADEPGHRAMGIKFVTRYVINSRPSLKGISEERIERLTKRVGYEFRKATRILTEN